MARYAREYSKTGLYHIIFRGISRQDIFEEDKDYIKLIEIIDHVKCELKFEIYAYCLMSNHVHILIKENEVGDISIIFKRILTKYAGWYNRKYIRNGALVGNRYKSKPVVVDSYLLSLVRYIHQNPTKAGIVSEIEDYKWSSYNEYVNKNVGITDIEFILKIAGIKEFKEYHKKEDQEVYELSDRTKESEHEIKNRVRKLIDGREPRSIKEMGREERNKWVKMLKDEGLSIREIERVTGVSRGIVAKC